MMIWPICFDALIVSLSALALAACPKAAKRAGGKILRRVRGLRQNLSLYPRLFIFAALSAAALPHGAQAQIGVGFTDNGWYEGTIGSNKGAVEGYRCPNGGVIRGFYHVDKALSGVTSSARGMTAQISLYCATVMMTNDKKPRVYYQTPNGTPTVNGAAYPGQGTKYSWYCNINQVGTRVIGTSRNSTQWPWTSTIGLKCRPLKIQPGDWMAIDNSGASSEGTAGIQETWLWPHNWTGWFCAENEVVAANGIYRQAGGEGWDGVNIYCATIKQARFSARIEFHDFIWDKTLGPDGWLTNLTKDNTLLEQTVVDPDTGENVIISGRDKRPYSSIEGTDNDPNTFQYDYELYVLPGKGYGANLSHRPENIPQKAYAATSSCISTVSLNNHDDKTCQLDVTGRPDIAVGIAMDNPATANISLAAAAADDETPAVPFLAVGETRNVTISGVNLGPASAKTKPGFALNVTAPKGWTPQAVPGCTVSGQVLKCPITAELAAAPNFGENGGNVTFTFPIKTNSAVTVGTFDLVASLDRTATDATKDPVQMDYETANDVAKTPVRFAKMPVVKIAKTSLGSDGSFAFSGTNGWKDQTIKTDAAGKTKTGDAQILTAVQTPITITETLQQGWLLKDVTCGGKQQELSNNSFTLAAEDIDYDVDITCTVTNQLVGLKSKKTSDIGAAAVQPGDIITYTLTTDVVGGPSQIDTVLTDTPSANMQFVGVKDGETKFTADVSKPAKLKFTLPQGTPEGSYTISYQMKVRANASSAVSNAVAANNGGCEPCQTQNPLVQISTAKKSNIGNNNPIETEQEIIYTLITTVSGGATTSPVVLTDKPSDNLTFTGVADAGQFTADTSDPKNLIFTLPKDTPAGVYQISYKAKVKADGKDSVSNNVSASSGTCDNCVTQNPIVSLRVNKSSDIGDGNATQSGALITYTLSVEVNGSFTATDTHLTDTLSAGLEFQSVKSAGRFTADTSAAPVLAFTLPKGTPTGTYKISYTARATADAKKEVSNKVTTDKGVCQTCETKNPIVALSTVKTIEPAGKAAQTGDILTYTLATTVSGGATTKDTVLTDRLDSNLEFVDIVSTNGFSADTAALTFTLPKGQAEGVYKVSYRVRVKGTAKDAVKNAVTASSGGCDPCSVTTPLVSIDTVKTADVDQGEGLQTGDKVTYTLTTTVKGGATTKETLLTDTLGKGLTFDSIVNAGDFTSDVSGAPAVKFTLPANMPAGVYQVRYSAKVNNSAGLTVDNKVVPSDGTSCSSCAVKIPVVRIDTVKTSDIGSGAAAQKGDTITYTLTTTVTDGPTTRNLVLTDTMNEALDFAGIVPGSPFEADTSNGLKFTLPAGTASGTYKISYKGKVKNTTAATEANNTVTADSGTCSSCSTANPLASIHTVKTSDAPNGKALQRGDIVTYTLTTTVNGNNSTQDTVLTDTLGSGLKFNAIKSAGSFQTDTSAAPALKFTLPANTRHGAYSVSYTATVTEAAASSVANTVTAIPGTCDPCATQNPITTVSAKKSSDAGDQKAVAKGALITYTLTVTVKGGASTQATQLTDTLGDSLDFVSVVPGSAFSANLADKQKPQFTLPKGMAEGTYTVSYKARVRANATKDAQNSVAALPVDDSGKPIPGSTVPCAPCATKNPLLEILTSKVSSAGSGPVQAGDIITYTLTSVVKGGATGQDTLLSDTLGVSLEYAGVSNAGSFTVDESNKQIPAFKLPKGTPPGTYSVSYKARVRDDAKQTVNNSVIAQPLDDAGQPVPGVNLPCSPCATVNPLSTVNTAKKSNIGTAAVSRGDMITYTLTATVNGGATSQSTILTDTLSDGLEFVSINADTHFAVDTSKAPILKFTLPKGTAAGAYAISYQARVKTTASEKVNNNVVAQAADDSGNLKPLPCDNCSITNPIVEISSAKTSDRDGKAAQPGDTITYTLTTTVKGGVSTQPVLLTDTLGTGLSFGAVTRTGAYSADTSNVKTPKFTLPAGTPAGIYSVVYTVKVGDDAVDPIVNSVIAQPIDPKTGKPVPGVNLPCSPCATSSPLASNSSSKSASPESGTSVQKGDIITYTLTTNIVGGASTQPIVLTDTLGKGLIFKEVTNPGSFTAQTGSAPMSFTLPAGTPAGSYSVSFTAAVGDITGSAPAQNVMTTNNGTCDNCRVSHPVSHVSAGKSSDVGDRTVLKGDIITYTLTTTISDAASSQDTILTDEMGNGLELVPGSVNPGPFRQSGADLIFTLPKGTAPGTYSVEYKAKVVIDAPGSVKNTLIPKTEKGDELPCVNCSVENSLVGLNTAKTAKPESGSPVQRGDTITYSFTTTVLGSSTNSEIVLSDMLSDSMEDMQLVNADAAFAQAGIGTNNPVFTLPENTAPGTYTVSYTAKVKADAKSVAANKLTASAGSCSPCATRHPLVGVNTAKSSDIGDQKPVQIGDIITYTLTSDVEGVDTTPQDTLLTDTLGSGLEFVSVVEPSDGYVKDISGAPVLKFTLKKGAAGGKHTISYKARVTSAAKDVVANSVAAASVNNDGTQTPLPCDPCRLQNPLAQISTVKSSDSQGKSVQPGDTITYTLTTNIVGGTTTQDLVLTDTLSPGLEFAAVLDMGSFSAETNKTTPKFTLPKGTPAGTYTVSYTAKVKSNAISPVSNSVSANIGSCDACKIQNPLVNLITEKTSNIGDNKPVQVGDIIIYKLATTIKNGLTSQDTILSDNLNDTIEFIEFVDKGDFDAEQNGNQLTLTLPAAKGTNGVHTATYRARVKDPSGTAARNSAAANNGDCNRCNTNNPLAQISAAKSAAPTGSVQIGDIITYTLTTAVKGNTSTQNTVLADTLGKGLEFVSGSIRPGAYKQNGAGLNFTLPAGTAPGTYSVSYQARATADAVNTVNNSLTATPTDKNNQPVEGATIPCDPCSVSNPVVSASTVKVSSAAGKTMRAGDIITYTLTTTVSNGITSQPILLSDTLGSGLDFAALDKTGSFLANTNAAPKLSFTLPAGTPPGTYSVSYKARVKTGATEAKNSVVAQPIDPNTGKPVPGVNLPCDPCATLSPVAGVSTVKTASPTGAVQAGDIITYKLTTTVKGGKTDKALTLTDTLNPNLQFEKVLDGSDFTANTAAQPTLSFVLPAGSGSDDGTDAVYTVSYTARVKESATSSVDNFVVADDGTCDPCQTRNPVATIITAKKADPADGSPVAAGDIITYTLTTTVAGGASAKDTLLTDTLSDGLEFVSVDADTKFKPDTGAAPVLKFTLAKGAAAGVYTVSYKARVTVSAAAGVKNSVIAQKLDDSGAPEGPLPCSPCSVANPIVAVSTAKTSDIGDGTPVNRGDILTYTLTSTVKDGPTTQDILLTDTLGENLEFVSAGDQSGYKIDTSAAPELKFTMLKGARSGAHKISYKVRVKADAASAAENTVKAQPLDPGTGKPIDGVTLPCEPCATKNPLIEVNNAKTSDIGDKTAVQMGDIITYTLSTAIKGGATTQDILLTDTLGKGLEFVSLGNAAGYSADTSAAPNLKFTLLAGAAEGEHSISYKVRVNAQAAAMVANSVKAQPLDPDTGKPVDGVTLPCAPCIVQNPLINITNAKSSDVGSGAAVSRGDIITYTVATNIAGGASTQDILLTDTLGDNLEFVSTDGADGYAVDTKSAPTLKFTLKKGAAADAHSISYKARVKVDAVADAVNKVKAQPLDLNTGRPIEGADLPCDPCETKNPLVNIAAAKSSDIGNGNSVSKGDILTYTVAVNVTGGATTQPTALTDTLGDTLEFVEFVNTDGFKADSSAAPLLKFVMPKGTAAGQHKVSYKARVKADAASPARNDVTVKVSDPDGNPPKDENGRPIPDSELPQIPCNPCETQNPLVITATAKSSDVGTGNPVQTGQLITYRLTTTITGGASTQDIVLTDKLGDNLTFAAVKDAGKFVPNTAAQPISFTLPKGTAEGTYEVTYQAKVKTDAKPGENAENAVTANLGVCAPCETQNPIIGLHSEKSSDIGDKPVQVGNIITYTLATTVTGGATTADTHLTDSLGKGLMFDSVTNAGAFKADTSNAQKPVFTLPKGTPAGTYKISYAVFVGKEADKTVKNSVAADNGDCNPCSLENPLVGIKAQKSSDIGDGKPVQIGNIITYTVSVTITDGPTALSTLLTDTLGDSLDFIAVQDTGDFTSDTSDSRKPKFILPAGTGNGTYKASYRARVRKDAEKAADNSVAATPLKPDNSPLTDSQGNPLPADKMPAIPCEPCVTENPLGSIFINKTTDALDNNAKASAVQRGDTITYTLNISVLGAPTPYPVLLTDTLNSNLEFVSMVDKGPVTADTSAAPVLKFTLPKDTPANSNDYLVSYKVRVKADAAGKDASTGKVIARNTVVPQALDDSGAPLTGPDAPQVPCRICATENPIIGVRVQKESNIGDGAYVQRGDLISYRLRVNVEGGKTTKAIALTDTMNNSLEYIGAVDCGKAFPEDSKDDSKKISEEGPNTNYMTAANLRSHRAANVPAGTPEGQSDFCYQARVTETAEKLAENSVIAQYTDYQGNPIDDPSAAKIPCEPCATQNPLSGLQVSKSSDVGDGAEVHRGDVITYKLKLKVDGGATTQSIIFTDTLDKQLEYVGVPNDDNSVIAFDPVTSKPDASPPVIKFLAYPGLRPGEYTVSYQAKVKANAVNKVSNTVAAISRVTEAGGTPVGNSEDTPLPCAPCATQNPVVNSVTINKQLVEENGAVKGMAEPGETLTYEITVENSGGEVKDYAVQDILDKNVSFLEADNSGAHSGGAVEWAGLTLPGAQNGAKGSLKLRVKTKVNSPVDDKAATVFNFVKEKGTPDPDCAANRSAAAATAAAPLAAAAANQCVSVPLAKPKLSLKKTVSFEDKDGTDDPSAGDILHYAFTLSNDGQVPLKNIAVADKGPSFNGRPAANPLGAFSPATVDIEPGQKAVIKADYTLADTDIENSGGRRNAVANTASAKGYISGSTGGDDPAAAVSSNDDTAKLTLAAPKHELTISKTAEIRAIRRGEQVPYTIRVVNNSPKPVNDARIVDRPPSGFRFVEDSASVDKQAAKPKIEGRNIVFENISLAPQQNVEIRLNLLALSSATPGEYVNRAHVEDASGNRLTKDAKATVEILVEHVFDCADVIGTVFDDYNRNGYQDDGEQGLAGVRLATAKGWIITTDTFGRYHIPCAALPDSRIGSNFIVKLDARSLPSGYRLTTENPRVVRLTAGKLTKINFGASISRIVRLDLRNEAFEPAQAALKPEWNTGVAELIEVLAKEQSVLRLSYIDSHADKDLAQRRINSVERLVQKIWKQKKGRYRLEIETRVEVGG